MGITFHLLVLPQSTIDGLKCRQFHVLPLDGVVDEYWREQWLWNSMTLTRTTKNEVVKTQQIKEDQSLYVCKNVIDYWFEISHQKQEPIRKKPSKYR